MALYDVLQNDQGGTELTAVVNVVSGVDGPRAVAIGRVAEPLEPGYFATLTEWLKKHNSGPVWGVNLTTQSFENLVADTGAAVGDLVMVIVPRDDAYAVSVGTACLDELEVL